MYPFRNFAVVAAIVCFLLLDATSTTTAEEARNVILVTIDGLRWQEVFGGADERLMSD